MAKIKGIERQSQGKAHSGIDVSYEAGLNP